jgi:hypothetical protein
VFRTGQRPGRRQQHDECRARRKHPASRKTGWKACCHTNLPGKDQFYRGSRRGAAAAGRLL